MRLRLSEAVNTGAELMNRRTNRNCGKMTIEGSMNMYSYYEIYECPSVPTMNGKYIGATPIMEQALNARDRHNAEIVHGAKAGAYWMVKGVLSNGDRIVFL